MAIKALHVASVATPRQSPAFGHTAFLPRQYNPRLFTTPSTPILRVPLQLHAFLHVCIISVSSDLGQKTPCAYTYLGLGAKAEIPGSEGKGRTARSYSPWMLHNEEPSSQTTSGTMGLNVHGRKKPRLSCMVSTAPESPFFLLNAPLPTLVIFPSWKWSTNQRVGAFLTRSSHGRSEPVIDIPFVLRSMYLTAGTDVLSSRTIAEFGSTHLSTVNDSICCSLNWQIISYSDSSPSMTSELERVGPHLPILPSLMVTSSTRHLPAPGYPAHRPSPAPSASSTLLGTDDYLPRLSPLPPSVHTSNSILEAAKDFKIENSVLANVHGNAVIYKFDIGGPPSEEFKSVFTQHIAGSVTIQDLDKMRNRMEKHALSQAIRDLPRANAAHNDYTSSKKRRVACFRNTRQALLKEIALCVTSTDGPRAYLLFGIAGVGKSTIAQTFAARADDLRLLGASFFFSRDEEDRRNARKFFTSIAFQLCSYDKRFAHAIGKALTEEGAAAMTKDPQQQLKALILEPLKPIVKSCPLPTVIVVDALDECDADDRPSVLMALNELVQELPSFRVVLTTRPQPRLQFLLESLTSHHVFRMEDIESKVVDGDIQLYLTHSLSQEQVHVRLPTLRHKWSANNAEIDFLVQASGRLFIIASTAVLFILDEVTHDPATQMKKLQSAIAQDHTPFKALNDFYAIILRSAVPLDCDDDIVERYQDVVGAIILLENPLPIDALANLILHDSASIHAVLVNLQSVISVSNDNTPLIYHKSFPDYLTDAKRCKDKSFRIVPEDHHTRIATCCLQVMNKLLRRNILDLGSPAQYFDNNKALEEEGRSAEDVQRAIPLELHYASVHWAVHVQRADLGNNALMAELRTFTKEHALHWLEALSWIRKFDTTYIPLGIILQLQGFEPDLRQIFSDLLRLASRHFESIKQSALHTYHSALPFAPTKTLLHGGYKHELLFCRIEGPENWDPLVATMKHQDVLDNYRGVRHVTFSSGGSHLASCNLNNMKLWDATSGTPIKTFDSGRMVLAADFSVVAMPQGSSVTVYSVSSSAPIASFHYSAEVVSLALSFDGSRLATGLENGTVSVWDVVKYVSIVNLDEYDAKDGKLVFTPSSYCLAFTASNAIILSNGAEDFTRLEHESERPVEIVFSEDGTRLASLERKDYVYSLRLWNKNGNFIDVARDVGFVDKLAMSADGSLLATVRGREDPQVQLWSGNSLSLVAILPLKGVWSLAFSDDMLAIASFWDNSVTLYDVKNCASIATLQTIHPSCLAFSSDGSRLAVGKYDLGAVHLWDVPSIKASPPAFKPGVSRLIISPDCSRLACGLHDGTVELWDTSTMRQAIASHNLFSGWIILLVFSPDGNRLAAASGEDQQRLEFLDGRDGTPAGVLKHPFYAQLHSAAFSSSSLAVGTILTTTLWDRKSLQLIHTFDYGSQLLSFSLDNSLLVSAHSQHNFFKNTPAWSETHALAVWDTEKRALAATFNFNSEIRSILLSPDGSRLAAETPNEDASFSFFDIANKKRIDDVKNGDIVSWVPNLNGIPISWNYDGDYELHLVGRFSTRQDRVPILWVPQDFRVRNVAGQSSTFALGSQDGRILLIRQPARH